MSQATLRDVVVGYASDAAPLMDDLEKESGIIRTATAVPASNNLWHKYKKLKALPTVSVIALDGTTTPQSLDFTIAQTDLSLFVAHQAEPARVAENYPGGVRAYFENERPGFSEAFAQKISTQAIYGNNATFGDASAFLGFHQIARNSGNIVARMAGATGSRTSIFAVKWKPTAMALLVNPLMAANGKFMKVRVLNGGQPVLMTTNTTTHAEQLVYQVVYELMLGMFSGTDLSVSAITQIQDDTSDKPTASNMDKLVDKIKGNSSNTVIYCNRTSKRLLGELKDSKLKTIVTDTVYSTTVDFWNGIPLIVDESILDTETTALD